MNGSGWLLSGVAAMLAGALAALAFRRRARLADALFRLFVSGGAALVLVPAVEVLGGGVPVAASFRTALPGGPWVFGIDGLSAWFLLIVGGVGAVIAWYGVGYLAPERGHRPVGLAHAGVALLLAAMVGVVTAQAAVPFLLAWEVMAVGAYFLIVFESEHRETRRAGLIYLVLTHGGALALVGMFLTWGGRQPDLTFATLASAAPGLGAGAAVVLLLGLLGFGVKAGVVPFHFWLPGAHAAAPSHVSALLSAVMLKTGIYGLFRIITLLGIPPAWWGWLLLIAGVASGVLGVLWALGQQDLKRVLAYSSVENIGIILLGMGTGVLGLAYHRPVIAVLGLAAALVHSLNHALFKSLLFLGAGAVIHATGARDINRLGGLGRRLPLTALAMGIGAVAIVGLPPLNGFVGEWIAAQALLSAGRNGGVLSAAVLAVPGLALIAGLSLACFVRLVAMVFLGQPRSASATAAAGDDHGLVGPMAMLLLACVAIGLAPVAVVRPAFELAGAMAGASRLETGAVLDPIRGAVAGISVAGVLLLGISAAAGLLRFGGRARARTAWAATWGCGYARPTARMQYSASSFGAPLVSGFGAAARPGRERSATTLRTDSRDKILVHVALPLWERTRRAAASLRALQQGRVTQYLQYMVLTVLVLLGILFVSVVRSR